MQLRSIFASFSFVSLFVLSAAVLEDEKVNNANHIFNAIHSSMRQWGSSLNHNGMSFFLATVPAGTQLYHGTSNPEPVKGMEWLAFEPEHALIFARPRGPPHGHPPKNGEPPQDGMWIGEGEDGNEPRPDCGGHHHPPPPPPGYHHEPPFDHHAQRPPMPPPHRGGPPHDGPPPPPWPPGHPHGPPPPFHGPPHNGARPPHHPPPQHPFKNNKRNDNEDPPKPGYLHTYVPKNSLHLLYVDGMSAGKTNNGTLDTQDILLLNLSTPDHSPMGGEIERARQLCNLSSTLWQKKIDGVLRMEGGFEIILCDFERDLEVKDIMTVVEGGPGFHDGGMLGGWQYYKAITERYHGIGGGRVEIDYEDFVSVFGYEGLELWRNDVESDVPMPRLQNVAPADLVKIKDAVTAMILSSSNKREGVAKTNWQSIADMLVTRYSTPLHHLHSNANVRSSKEDFATYLAVLLRPFIDHTSRNITLETQRCIAQFVPALPRRHPPASAPSLAHLTVHSIANTLCTTLLTSLSITTQSLSRSSSTKSAPPARALALIDDAVSYLQWTTWKQCGPCADEEICIIPIWPMGTLQDHARPSCKDEKAVSGRGGYWGRFGPPGGGHSHGPEGGHGPGPSHGDDGRRMGMRVGVDVGLGRGRKDVRGGGLGSWIARVGGWLRELGRVWSW